MKMNDAVIEQFWKCDYTDRQRCYASLNAEEKDALFKQVTDSVIAKVPSEVKRNINRKMNRTRPIGTPAHINRVENKSLWRSCAWYFIMGHVSKKVWRNIPRMEEHFNAVEAAIKK